MSSNWSMSEDVQLCISYCRQSVDPITGAKQKVDKLWEKVHTDFQANWVMGEDEIITTDPRSHSALQSRFAKLKPNLILWGSCISYARRNPESGCNLQDEIRKAQVLYVAKRKKTFIHFECWEHVKNHPTFAVIEATTPTSYTYQASPAVEEVHTFEVPLSLSPEIPGFSTPESNPGSSSSPIRPPGVKAAKEARRKGKKVTNSSTQEALLTIAETQKKFLEMNQKQMENDWKLQQKAFNLAKMEEETKIMQMNTDVMTPKSKRYFSKRKAAILREYEEEDANNDQGPSGDNDDCYRPSF